MLLALIGAVLIGVSLGLLGSGGSILTVPVLVYLVGQPEKVAIAGSLGVVGAIALLGCIQYAREGLVSWRHVVLFGIPGMVGTWGGAWVSKFVSASAQMLLFAVVMALAAAFMLRSSKQQGLAASGEDTKGDAGTGHPSEQASKLLIVGEGLLVGVVTGLVGVGGGFLIVPALALLARLPMRRAIGTSLVIIALKSGAGFQKYLALLAEQGIELDWLVLGAMSGVGFVGSVVGKKTGSRVPQAALRRIFAYFLIAMACFILVTSLSSK